MRASSRFFMVAVGLVVGHGVSSLAAQGNKDSTHVADLYSRDSRSPQAFTEITEIGRDEKPRRVGFAPSTIVDNDSRLLVTFRTDLLNAGLHADECAALLERTRKENRFAQADSIMRSSLNQGVRDSIRTVLQKLAVEAISDCNGYDLSIRARVVPRTGVAFDLPIAGYVAITQTAGNEDTVTQLTTSFIKHQLGPVVHLVTGNWTLITEDDLADAAIDLPDDDSIKEGDHLEVTVTNDFGGTTRNWVWDLEIRDVGFKNWEDASLLLIKRTGIRGSTAASPQLDSDFKPTPGFSFMMTYKPRSRALIAIRPSLGINASFVDFLDNKDLEIGVGPVLSFFGGVLQFGYGWDLHADKHRGYWSLGLGITGVTNKLSPSQPEQ